MMKILFQKLNGESFPTREIAAEDEKEQSTFRELRWLDLTQGGSGRRMGEEGEDHGRDQLMAGLVCARLESVDSSGSWKGGITRSRDRAIRLVPYKLPGKSTRGGRMA